MCLSRLHGPPQLIVILAAIRPEEQTTTTAAAAASIFSPVQIYFKFSSPILVLREKKIVNDGEILPPHSALIPDKSGAWVPPDFGLTSVTHSYYTPATTSRSDRIAISESHFAVNRRYAVVPPFFFFPAASRGKTRRRRDAMVFPLDAKHYDETDLFRIG